jgi:PiT family inorganic phosphate transporter
VSSAAFSLGHGANDAQKVMGLIYILLITNGYLQADDTVPLWVILSCHFVIAMGTLFGGWQVIKTLGQRLTKLQPSGGFCAETAAASALWGTALLGIPVSTTHTITGGIMGVGAVTRLSAVRWGVAKDILLAWVFTIPFSAAMAALCYWLLSFFVN